MNGTSLDAVSKATSSTIQTATAVSLINPFVPNIGQEPQVVGKAFGLANGKTSGIIEGFNGMFMVQKINDVKAPANSNYTNYINQLKQQGMGSVGRVLQVLKDKAEIKDNRANVMQ
jgi:peptidyl-prolyl cis-trans isomerase D